MSGAARDDSQRLPRDVSTRPVRVVEQGLAARLQATVTPASGVEFATRAERRRWGSTAFPAPVADTEAYTLDGTTGWQDAFVGIACDDARKVVVLAQVPNSGGPAGGAEFRVVTRSQVTSFWVPVVSATLASAGDVAALSTEEIAMQFGVQVRNTSGSVGQVNIAIVKEVLP